MVYPDFSFEEKAPPGHARIRIASVSDRLLAFLIDFLILSPVIGLVTAGLLKELRTLMILRADSPETWILWFSLLSSWFLLVVVAEAVCVAVWRGTPGQRFMQLEVRSIVGGAPLDLGQSLGRSFVHWLGFIFLLPLLAVYTHPLRRALHDRAFDTIVLTKKTEGDKGPIEMERNFFQSWSRMMALLAALACVGIFSGLRTSYQNSVALSMMEDAASPFCEDLDASWKGADRMDRAIGLFVAGMISASCLEKESEQVLWKQDGPVRALAEVAKGLVHSEDDLGKEHLDRACREDENGEACAIAAFARSTEEDRGDVLRKKGLSTFTARLLLLRETVDREQFASAAALIADLRQEALFDPYLAREEVRNIWRIQRKSSGREPASSELRDLVRSFEERYELP